MFHVERDVRNKRLVRVLAMPTQQHGARVIAWLRAFSSLVGHATDHSVVSEAVTKENAADPSMEPAGRLVVIFDVRACEEAFRSGALAKLRDSCEGARPRPRAIVLTGVGSGTLRRDLADWLSSWTPMHGCAVIILRDDLPDVPEPSRGLVEPDLGPAWTGNAAVHATSELYMELFANDAT